MHAKPMTDSDGTFDGWKRSKKTCGKCDVAAIKYRTWESSCGGYEDEHFVCENCGHSWWVDGPDA